MTVAFFETGTGILDYSPEENDMYEAILYDAWLVAKTDFKSVRKNLAREYRTTL
jgi:hypothetical protein